MDTKTLIASIDAEIARLEKVKSLLTGASTTTAKKASKSGKAATKTAKRTLSPEALERIREGQRKRWAKAKRAKRA